MKRFCFSFALLVLIAVLTLNGCAPAIAPTTPPPAVKKEAPGPAKPEWEQKWDQMVAAAKKEGIVVVYGEVGPDLRAGFVKEFGEKYGIEIDVVSGRPPEVARRYLTERTANLFLADVFILGQTTTPTILKPEGVLAPLEQQIILPEALDPKTWPEGKLPFLDKDGTTLALVSGYRTFIAINTDLVKPGEISSLEDLTNPKWKEKIAINDPTTPGAGGTWAAFVLLKSMGMEEGQKYLRKVAEQKPIFTRDTRLHAEWIAKGKYPVGVSVLPQPFLEMVKAGAPIAWVRPLKEGGMILTASFALALPVKPPHPNAAQVMLNWSLTKEGQTVFSRAAGEPARKLGVPLPEILLVPPPQPGEKVYWLDEDFIMKEPTLYPLSREIFGIR